MKTLILWDWDNTLVDTFGALYTAQNIMRKAFGLSTWTKEEAAAAMNKSGRNLIKDLVGEEKADAAREVYLKAYAQSAAQISLKPNAINVLEKVKALGFINVLASNKAGSLLRNEAHTLNVDSYFDRIIGAEDAHSDKPSKVFTDAAIAGFAADRIVSIGDGKADIQMGHNYENGAGILISADAQSETAKEADKVFPDLMALEVYLEQVSE